MNIKEIIELLAKLPEDAIAIIDGGDWTGTVTRIEYNEERNQVELHCDE